VQGSARVRKLLFSLLAQLKKITFSCAQKNPIRMYRVLGLRLHVRKEAKRNYRNDLETILQNHQIGYVHLEFHSLLPFSEQHYSSMEVHRNTIPYLLVIHVYLGTDQSQLGE
jgi:hypothetical protein